MQKREGMRTTNALNLFHLRALIAAMGEINPPPWWKSQFMSETGLRFLERLYPRTYYQAAVNAAGKAACKIHDEAVGRVGVYHLFRLPDGFEQGIFELKPSESDPFLEDFRPDLGNMSLLQEHLAGFAGSDAGEPIESGPVNLGSVSKLRKESVIAGTASAYLNAFKTGVKTFPYFTIDQDDA